jgi:hypothetical protein
MEAIVFRWVAVWSPPLKATFYLCALFFINYQELARSWCVDDLQGLHLSVELLLGPTA